MFHGHRNIGDLFKNNEKTPVPYFLPRRNLSQEIKQTNNSTIKLPSFHLKRNSMEDISISIEKEVTNEFMRHSQKIPRRVLLNIHEQKIAPFIQDSNSRELLRIHSPEKPRISRPYLNLQRVQMPIANTVIENQKQSRHIFNFLYVIGSGGFGKVWKVELKKTRQVYAMKELNKAKVLAKKSVKSVMNERNFLVSLKHPFLVNMVSSFQDRDHLYLVMDYQQAGDLRYHLIMNKTFKEEQIKFILGCVILGLEYTHSQNVIHRDIKPENLVMDQEGYIKITDFGIARTYRLENGGETSGTVIYMAPEVLCRQNHSYGVDHYALGVLAYEMMIGTRPFNGKSRRELRDSIMATQIQLTVDQVNYSPCLIDLVNGLLMRKPHQRLGYLGDHQLKEHPFFKDFQWHHLLERKLTAPYVPVRQDDYRQIRFEEESQCTLIAEMMKQLRLRETQQQFIGYTYNTEPNLKKHNKQIKF